MTCNATGDTVEQTVRESGIEMMGRVPWGTHFCQFYQTRDDLLDTIVPYFKAGLESNEFCMWVTSWPLDVSQAREALRERLGDLDQYIQKGQLEIVSYSDWYVKDGVFESNRVLRGWVDKLNDALARGYDGLRLTGNTFWLETKDWESFTSYEREVDGIIGQCRILALCTYQVDRCSLSEVVDVMSNHRCALVKRKGRWDVIESVERRRVEEELKQLNEELEASLLAARETAEREQSLREELEAHNEEIRAQQAALESQNERLREAETKYRIVADNTYDWEFWLNGDGNFVYCSPSCERITGYSARDFYADAALYSRIVHPGDFPLFAKHCAEEMRAGTAVKASSGELEFRIVRANGEELWISHCCQAVHDAEGRFLGTRGNNRDITERKRAREALLKVNEELTVANLRIEEQAEQAKRRAAELEAIVESTHAQLAVLDANLNFVLVNSAYAAGSGHAKEELIGRNHFDLFPNEENRAIFERVRDTGEPYQAIEKPFEYADQPERGVTYWNWTLVPIKGKDERVEELLFTLLDVTPQVRARQQVEQLAEEARHRVAEMDITIESIADGLVIHSPTGEIIRMNPAAEAILGFSLAGQKAFAEGAAAMEAETPETRLLSVDKLPAGRALQGETVRNEVVSLQAPSGKTRWVSVSSAPIITSDGVLLGAISVLTDVTAQHELQELREDYISLITHDLCNPLASIMGQADWLRRLLERKGLDTEAKCAEAIVTSSKRMNSMIQDLRDSARLEWGGLEIRKEPADLVQLVYDVVDRTGSPEDRARIQVECAERGCIVAIDPERIERVVTNLIANALKYSPSDRPVKVRLRQEARQAVLSVEDHGIGIGPDDLPHVFEKGYRAKGASRTNGLGLGLYITRMLVEAHGGRVWVESELGKGSAFHCTLPLFANSPQ